MGLGHDRPHERRVQCRANAIRDYEERERQAKEREAVEALGLACPVNGEDEQAA